MCRPPGYKAAFLALCFSALNVQSAKSISAYEAQALRECQALQKKIGPRGTKNRMVLQNADKVIVPGLPMTAERQPIGAKIFRVEKERFFLQCQKD